MRRQGWWLALVILAGCAAQPRPVPSPSASTPDHPSPPAAPASVATDDATGLPVAADINGAGLVDERHGWILTATDLIVTADAGVTWRAATPVEPGTAELLGATFADADRGWVATTVPKPDSTTFDIWRTRDGGRTWDRAAVPEGINRGDLIGTVSFSVADDHLFAMVEGGMPTGYTGDLYASTDDGGSWTPKPILQDAGVTGPIAFADGKRGVVAGGAPGDRLFGTDDGGGTWHRTTLPAPVGFADTVTQFPDAPTFWSDRAGGVPVIIGNTERATTIAVLTTDDGGGRWRIAGSVPLAPDNGAAVAALPDPTHWLVIAGGLGATATGDGGATWSRLEMTGLPAVPDELSMPDPTHGWAIVRISGCQTFKTDCSTRSGLFATDDGGATWSLIWPTGS